MRFYRSRSEQFPGLLRIKWRGKSDEILVVVHSAGFVLAFGDSGFSSLPAGLAIPIAISNSRHSRGRRTGLGLGDSDAAGPRRAQHRLKGLYTARRPVKS